MLSGVCKVTVKMLMQMFSAILIIWILKLYIKD